MAVTEKRTLLAVHAHPDDECIGTGGILARYAAEGARTVLVTCTDGAVGEISDPALATPDNLAEVRSQELDESVRILNVIRLRKLGYRASRIARTETPLSRADSAPSLESAEPPPFVVDDDRVTRAVDVSAYISAKRAALESHRTQMGAEQFFMKLPPDLFVEAFGRETFQRVAGSGPTPETDLFDGRA